MTNEQVVNGLKTNKGFGLLMSIKALEVEMASVQNDVAYSMMKARHDEWQETYNKYYR